MPGLSLYTSLSKMLKTDFTEEKITCQIYSINYKDLSMAAGCDLSAKLRALRHFVKQSLKNIYY
jgi:hypothetical protein